jgi:hypothetical protein
MADFMTVNCMRFQVLTVVGIKVTAFWNRASCSLVEADLCFGGPDDEGSTHF